MPRSVERGIFGLNIDTIAGQFTQIQLTCNMDQQGNAEKDPVVGDDLFRGKADQKQEDAQRKIGNIIHQFRLLEFLCFATMDQRFTTVVSDEYKVEDRHCMRAVWPLATA